MVGKTNRSSNRKKEVFAVRTGKEEESNWVGSSGPCNFWSFADSFLTVRWTCSSLAPLSSNRRNRIGSIMLKEHGP